MKRTFLSVAMLGLALNLFAQDQSQNKGSHIYFRAGGTYAFPHAGQTSIEQGQFVNGKVNFASTTNGGVTQNNASWDIKSASFGAGITAVVAGGYMVSKNIGIELAASIGISQKKYTFTESDPFMSQGVNINQTVTGKFYQKTPVLIMPSVVIQTGGNKLNVYSRVGLALPVGGKMIWEYEEYRFVTSASLLTTWTYEQKNKFALGLQGALGVQVGLSDNIKIYVEANGVSLNAYAKKATMTKYTQNGTEYLDQLDVYDKEIEFNTKGTSTNPAPNPNVARQNPTFSNPYSNIGIGAGLLIKL